jgi:hypothetical protein
MRPRERILGKYDMTATQPTIAKAQDVMGLSSTLKTMTTKEVIVALAAMLIFPKDYFITILGIHTEVLGIALLTICAMYIFLTKKQSGSFSPAVIVIFLFMAISWFGSLLWNGALNSSSYFASFYVALLLLIIRPRNFLLVMTLLMTVNTVLQLYESSTGDFLFAYEDDDFVYDEKMLSTADGALRAKGLWGSPLNAIGIVMSLAFLKPRSVYLWCLLCLSSTLGQGRLGLAVGVLGLLISIVSDDRQKSRKYLNIVLGVGALLGIAIFIILFGTDDSIQRLMEAGSTDNSQNISRLYYWGQSIIEIMNFDIFSHLYGRFGYIKALQGGTESDWLRIWLDNGLFCVFAYLIPLISKFFMSMRGKRWPESYAYIATFFVMTVYPHAQSMPNGTLVWLLLLMQANSIQSQRKS